MDKFWELFEKNVVISGLLAIGLVYAVVYLSVTGQPVPVELGALAGAVVGYFFGAGKAKEAAAVIRKTQ